MHVYQILSMQHRYKPFTFTDGTAVMNLSSYSVVLSVMQQQVEPKSKLMEKVGQSTYTHSGLTTAETGAYSLIRGTLGQK